MAIINNTRCPKCSETGHDKTGNHLIWFDDNAVYCPRASYHKSGEVYYKKKGDKNAVLKLEVDGTINYTEEQFNELLTDGKLNDPRVRELALLGMREETRYKCMDEDEQSAIESKWDRELKHFSKLKVKNLVSRGIRGEVARLYNVRVGVDGKGRVARHYYPVYDEHMELIGAKCRNLPKDFRTGRLGHSWGKTKLFGQNTVKTIAASGTRKDVLLIVGGECDTMAAQQMLCEVNQNPAYKNRLYHVWSVTKGEHCLAEIADNLKQIRKFKKVIFAFDADEVGAELNRKACNLIRDRAHVLEYPDGCKDANECLMEGRAEEFVDAWWKADKPHFSSIKTLDDPELWAEANEEVTMGISWPWPTMTDLTFGIRLHNMYTIGGGSGVGKTETAKEVVQHLIDCHNELVGVVFMEERASFTAKVLAGKWINKKIHLPANHHPKGHEKWDKGRDYTAAQSLEALKALRAKGRLRIADCKGDTHIDNIMAMCEELRAQGVKYIFIDNLTTIAHEGKEGSVKAIDESMRRLGTFMQENPVAIFLLSHLAKPQDPRKPYEEGGTVRMGDFRGSQSITFWSTFMIAVERNTQGDIEERCITTLRCVKDRLTGIATGETVTLVGNTKTGRVLEPAAHSMPARPKDKKKAKKSKKRKETNEY